MSRPTPICDFVRDYRASRCARFHMPGHKGRAYLGFEDADITEIHGADVLSEAAGIIGQSEDILSDVYGTAHSFYTTEGSSTAVKAMLALAVRGRDDRAVLAARNVHKSFIYAAALLDVTPTWLAPREPHHLCACPVAPEDIASELDKKHYAAVYLTSPDYLGNTLDVAAISKICREHSTLLLVDNAHGAYLKFLPEDRHPISLGADMCADSAHKTLPVLTGGAYLHVSKSAPPHVLAEARGALALFSSTSPSYLTLQSLDLCNSLVSDGFREKVASIAEKCAEIKRELASHGYTLVGDEPLKISVSPAAIGYTGNELAAIACACGVTPEFSDDEFAVFMLSASNTDEEISRLRHALRSVAPRPPLKFSFPRQTHLPQTSLSPRDALFAPHERVCISNARGRICAAPLIGCPPAVPPVMCGETIDDETAEILAAYGALEADVVK